MSDHNIAPWDTAEAVATMRNTTMVVDEIRADVILELSEQAPLPDDGDSVIAPMPKDDEPDIPPDALMEIPYHEMKVMITTPQYRGVPRGGLIISNSAKRVASALLTDPEPSPVFSFRDKVPDPSKSDFLLLLSSIRRRGPAIHMLSLGEVAVLGKDLECIAALVDLLDDGYVYACDFGELRFTTYAIITLLKAIRGDNANSPPPTNLAFVFLDSALGLTNAQIQDIKESTRRRRCADKKLLPNQVDRLHGAWLLPGSFQWIMESENLTRCFWRPYQERLFWERMGFKVPVVKKGINDSNKWVNYYVQELTKRFHKGTISASMLHTVDPDDRWPDLRFEQWKTDRALRCYLDDCLEQWSRVSLLRMKARLRPSSVPSSGRKSESPAAKRARKMSTTAARTSTASQGGSSDPGCRSGASSRPCPSVSASVPQKSPVLRKAIPKSGTLNHPLSPRLISIGTARATMTGTSKFPMKAVRPGPTPNDAVETFPPGVHTVTNFLEANDENDSAVSLPRSCCLAGSGNKSSAKSPSEGHNKTSQTPRIATPMQGGFPRAGMGYLQVSESKSLTSPISTAAVQSSAFLSESDIRKVVASQFGMSKPTSKAQFKLELSSPLPPGVSPSALSPRLKTAATAAKSKQATDTLHDTHSSGPSSFDSTDGQHFEPVEVGAITARLTAMSSTPTSSPNYNSVVLSAEKTSLPRGNESGNDS